MQYSTRRLLLIRDRERQMHYLTTAAHVEVEVKVWTLVRALPTLTNNWTHCAASRHTIAPISHTRPSPRSRSYYSFPVPLRVGG